MIAFLLPTLPPVRPEAEAYAQEIGALRQRFGGEVFYINPNRYLPAQFPLQIPRPVFGFHQLLTLRRAGSRCRLYQLYSPNLYAYPILRLLGRPIVYTVGGGAQGALEAADVSFFNRLAAVTVADTDSHAFLQSKGLKNVRLVRAGVDTSRFHPQPIPLRSDLHLLMASAPWTREQFASKGVDAMLGAVQRGRRLRLTLLWRGVLTREIEQRVERMGIGDRVAVIDESVDLSSVLAGVHATVNLADRSDIVKAYPHSLLDSLAAGKPVLVSRTIPMSAYVEDTGVGHVVEAVTPEAILEAVGALRENYVERQRAAGKHGAKDFGLEGMLTSYEEVYASIEDRERQMS